MVIPLIALTAGTASAGWISFNNSVKAQPEVNVQRTAWDGVQLDINVDGIAVEEVKTKGGVFTQLNLLDDAFKGELGSPRIPVIRKFVEVPYGAVIDLNVVASDIQNLDMTATDHNHRLIPVQPPVEKMPGALEAAPFVLTEAVYAQNQFLGGEWARIQDEDFLRGHRIVVIEVTPVRYNPVKNSLQCASDIEIQLNFTGANQELTVSNARRFFAPAFDQLLRQPGRQPWRIS